VQNVLAENGGPIVLDLALKNGIFKPFAVESEGLLVTSHIKGDRVLRCRLDLQLPTELHTPLVDIRFELANVGTHGANVVVRKRVLDRRIDLFPRDLALVALRIPDLDGEDRPILDPARHQSRPVVALRTVEAERDGIAVFERTKIR